VKKPAPKRQNRALRSNAVVVEPQSPGLSHITDYVSSSSERSSAKGNKRQKKQGENPAPKGQKPKSQAGPSAAPPQLPVAQQAGPSAAPPQLPVAQAGPSFVARARNGKAPAVAQQAGPSAAPPQLPVAQAGPSAALPQLPAALPQLPAALPQLPAPQPQKYDKIQLTENDTKLLNILDSYHDFGSGTRVTDKAIKHAVSGIITNYINNDVNLLNDFKLLTTTTGTTLEHNIYKKYVEENNNIERPYVILLHDGTNKIEFFNESA
jgi:hypothetical protein